MANHSSLTDLFTDIASAIRAKTGDSGAIVADAFPSAITAIPSGGGNTDVEDGIITRTLSGSYENSRITFIGYYAFFSCLLTNAAFANVKVINNYAFSGCRSLTTISFPQATDIGLYAFYSCFKLSSAFFPQATSVGSSAFARCTDLTTASFPKITYIGPYAFYSCSQLVNISFPSASIIGNWAFYGCRSLSSANFPQARSIGSSAFNNCRSLTDTSFPLVSFVGAMAFSGCTQLSTISLPEVSAIYSQTFANCTKLTALYLMSTIVTRLAYSNALLSTPIAGYSSVAGQYGSIYVPSSLYSAYVISTNWTYYSSRFVSVDTGFDNDI